MGSNRGEIVEVAPGGGELRIGEERVPVFLETLSWEDGLLGILDRGSS